MSANPEQEPESSFFERCGPPISEFFYFFQIMRMESIFIDFQFIVLAGFTLLIKNNFFVNVKFHNI
jgi:hypothetical protein